MKRSMSFVAVLAAALVMFFFGNARLAQAQVFGQQFYIKNAMTGHYLTSNQASVGRIWQDYKMPFNNQLWTFNGFCDLLHDARDCNGYIAIANVNSKGALVLDVPNLSMQSGMGVQQYSVNGGPNQQWLLVPIGGGGYKIMNRNSRKYLQVNSYSLGAPVIQADEGCYQGQVWYILYRSQVETPSCTAGSCPFVP